MDTLDKTWYLAGPMSGLPQFNFPLFDEAATTLRSHGFTIVSPAELDSEEVRSEALTYDDGNGVVERQLAGAFEIGNMTWGDALARDVKIVADECHGIILLPDWSTSRGARLEAFVGLLCAHSFAEYEPSVERVHFVTNDYIKEQIV